MTDPKANITRAKLNDDDRPLDLPLSNRRVDPPKKKTDITDIARIFLENIKTSTSAEATAGPSNRGCRHKHHTMGDVLNTEKVMAEQEVKKKRKRRNEKTSKAQTKKAKK